jgi:hypothetical protein
VGHIFYTLYGVGHARIRGFEVNFLLTLGVLFGSNPAFFKWLFLIKFWNASLSICPFELSVANHL